MTTRREKQIKRRSDRRENVKKWNARAKKWNATVAQNVKKAAGDSHYSWLPWVFSLLLAIAYLVMLHKPSGKTFDIFCNLTVMAGVLLVASGSVVTKEMRSHLFDVKDFDINKKDEHGNAPHKPSFSEPEIAKLFLDTSDKCEAGTLLVIAGSAAIAFHLIIDWIWG